MCICGSDCNFLRRFLFDAILLCLEICAITPIRLQSFLKMYQNVDVSGLPKFSGEMPASSLVLGSYLVTFKGNLKSKGNLKGIKGNLRAAHVSGPCLLQTYMSSPMCTVR